MWLGSEIREIIICRNRWKGRVQRMGKNRYPRIAWNHKSAARICNENMQTLDGGPNARRYKHSNCLSCKCIWVPWGILRRCRYLEGKCWIAKDLEGSDRGLIRCTNPTFSWRIWGELWKALVNVTGLSAGTQTNPLPSPHTSLERYRYINQLYVWQKHSIVVYEAIEKQSYLLLILTLNNNILTQIRACCTSGYDR
jgi:hypothetical protein